MKASVTVLGGGTGSFNVLSGLKAYADLHIRSIVTMMDSGGDSGRLRDEFGVLPPGDARRCLIALSEETEIMRDLFAYRFDEAPMTGRSFGNLFFLALTKTLGSEAASIDALSRILKIRGEVIPVTWDHSHLHARLADGTELAGEASIDQPQHDPMIPIKTVFLRPQARINPRARSAVLDADFLVFAPGDLYTSTIPNLLVDGVAEAVRQSKAPMIYVLNLMTKIGETSGYNASRHVQELARFAGRVPDAVLVHDGEIPSELLLKYEQEDAHQVEIDEPGLLGLGIGIVKKRKLMSAKSYVRHDPVRTASALLDLFQLFGNTEKQDAAGTGRGVPVVKSRVAGAD